MVIMQTNTNEGRFDLALRDILQDEALQVRDKTDEKLIIKYAENINAGTVFPPIEVADVNGVFYLTDGWHRLGAFRRLGRTHITAILTKRTRKESIWAAACANTTHGKPLSSKENRNVFRAFITSGQHRVGMKGKLMSMREIGRTLGRNHQTLNNWMREDFPVLHRKFGRPTGEGPRYEPDFHGKAEKEHFADAVCKLDASGNAGKIMSPAHRGRLIGELVRWVADLREMPYEGTEGRSDSEVVSRPYIPVEEGF